MRKKNSYVPDKGRSIHRRRRNRFVPVILSAMLAFGCLPVSAAEIPAEPVFFEEVPFEEQGASFDVQASMAEDQTEPVFSEEAAEDQPEPVFSDGVAEESAFEAPASAAEDLTDLSSMTILETDVTTPSEGCVFLGIHGKYISDRQAALDRVNAIRLEACREGIIDPKTSKPLTEADYVPIKWSGDLEKIARIRAAESALTGQHLRTNGNDCFSFDYPDEQKNWGEVLAWNWSDTVLEGIEQWYGEKEDWVNKTEGAVTGHYTSMIDPSNLYIGLGTFCSDQARFYNTTAGEFSFFEDMDETPAGTDGECIQKLEVNTSYLSGPAELRGETRGVAGDSVPHVLTTDTTYSSGSRSFTAEGLFFLNNVNWSSSNPAAAEVSEGTVTAKMCGSTQISASQTDSGLSASADFTVDHIEEPIPEVQPTCTKNGLTAGVRCSVCGEILTAQEEITALGHDYDEGVITTEPTCEEDGVKTFTCKHDPSHTLTEAVPALGHDYDEAGEITTAPTCEEAGVLTHYCKHDHSHFWTEAVPALGHDYDEGVITTEPTCEEDGVRTFTCKHDPSHTLTEAVPALKHDWDEGVITTAPTCEAAGVKTFTCKHDPSHTYEEALDALGHDYDEGVITTEPTCEEEGVKTFTCKHDPSHTKTEPVPARGHQSVEDPQKDPTCTETGLTAGTHCSVCEKVLSGREEIPVLGHDWDEGSETKAPTCTEKGVRTFTCKHDSSHTRTEEIPANGHSWEEDYTVDIDPTCAREGSKSIHCSVCDAIKEGSTQTIPETNVHKYGEWKTTKPATLHSEGLKEHVCSVCGDTETEVIPRKETESISVASVKGLSDQTYTGQPITQDFLVYDENIRQAEGEDAALLKEGTDYTVKYENNENAGTASVILEGMGSYTGTVTKTFEIKKADQKITATASVSTIFVGDSATISLTGNEGAKSFTPSNSSIAAVNSAGKVTGKKPGTVKITAKAAATANYNAASTTVTIVVKAIPISRATVACPASKVWTGSAHYPVPTLTYKGKKLTKGTHFTLKYSNNKNVGTATIVITGKGIYTGRRTKTFRINPKPTTISTIKPATGKLTINWRKQPSQTSGYQIQYSSRKDFKTQKTIKITSASTVKRTLSGLARKHKYYVRIRTFRNIAGKMYYSTWSPAKSATTK